MKQIVMTQTVNINLLLFVGIVPKAPKLNRLSIIIVQNQHYKERTATGEQFFTKFTATPSTYR
jgi:hypothetical protein